MYKEEKKEKNHKQQVKLTQQRSCKTVIAN